MNGLFSQGNRGRESIKVLILRASPDNVRKRRRWQRALVLIKGILSIDRLQHSALRCLIMPHKLLLDREVMSTLQEQQNGLQHLAIGPTIGVPPEDMEQWLNNGWLSCLQSLVILERIGSEHELTFYGQAIRNRRKMTALEIRTFKTHWTYRRLISQVALFLSAYLSHLTRMSQQR